MMMGLIATFGTQDKDPSNNLMVKIDFSLKGEDSLCKNIKLMSKDEDLLYEI